MSVTACSSSSSGSQFAYATSTRQPQLQQELIRANPGATPVQAGNPHPPSATVNGQGQVVGKLINVSA